MYVRGKELADIDCRWWYVKLKALTANRDWEGLEAFAKSKKSPIGYEPFVVSDIQFKYANKH